MIERDISLIVTEKEAVFIPPSPTTQRLILRRTMKRMLRFILRQMGYNMVRRGVDPLRDASAEERVIIERCRPFTMTPRERLLSVCSAVEYVVANGIPGDFVECGVWKGGSSMAAALTFLRLGRKDIDLHLYDTFEGMTEPGDFDSSAITGESAKDRYFRTKESHEGWCASPLDEVRANLLSTQYPETRLHFIKGLVEETIPVRAPDTICILRLDTDWYESTKHEMEHLFPRLSRGGILILDDYGHWTGSKKAVDEYLSANDFRLYLGRIDCDARIAVKF